MCVFTRVRAVIKEARDVQIHQSLVDEHVIYSCNVFNFTSPFFALPLRTLLKNQTTTGVVMEDCSLADYRSIPLHPEIRDNRLHTFFRNYPDTHMTDGIVVMMVAALQYMRRECLVHGDLHANNAFLTPLTSLYGFTPTSYMLFDTYQKEIVDNVTSSAVKLTGLVKIFDWDRAQILDANDPYLLADTLGFLRMLRFFRLKVYTDTIEEMFSNKNDERKRYEFFLSASARSRTFSGPMRQFVSVCRERRFELTRIGLKNATFHIKPTRVYEQKPNKYLPINEGDFAYEINDGNIKVWDGDELLSTLSDKDKDEYIFTWTLIQYQQTSPKLLSIKENEVLMIRDDIFIPIKRINAIVEDIYLRALSSRRERRPSFPLRFT